MSHDYCIKHELVHSDKQWCPKCRAELLEEHLADANLEQVGGRHYKNVTIQHWDFAIAQGWGYGYLAGQITKYVTRAPAKNGLEDLKKARHFLDKLIQEVEAGHISEIDPPTA